MTDAEIIIIRQLSRIEKLLELIAGIAPPDLAAAAPQPEPTPADPPAPDHPAQPIPYAEQFRQIIRTRKP